jgi:exodeoxyribonuclease VII small subunit
MAETPGIKEPNAATFEAKLARLEEIVRLLEGDAIPLHDSVTLFNEGRTLAQACEAMLRVAHETIEGTGSGGAPEPGTPPEPVAARREGAHGSLFDDDALA